MYSEDLIFYSSIEEAKYSLRDVCQFMSGSRNIPFGGFEKKITVEFEHFCQDKCHCLPVVSTCALSIRFPVHMNSYEKMSEGMDIAITESPFFGRV